MSFGEDVVNLVEKSPNDLHSKHSTWERVTIGEIAHLVNGYAFKSSGFNGDQGLPIVRIRDIVPGRAATYYSGALDDPKMTFIVDGDIAIGMDGDFNSRIWSGGRALLNQRVCTLRAAEEFYSQKLLAYLLPGYLKLVNDHTSSVTVKHLSSLTVRDIPVPLPPRNEQDRIVDRIETLFTQLDQGEASLRSVQTLLTRYRQSVLKAAVTGQLTADWRAENAQRLEHGRDLLQRILQTRRENWQGRGKYKEPAAPDTSELPELPEGWVWASLDALITDGPTNGLSPKESSTDNAVPSFKLTATTSGTFVIDESTVKYVGADVPPNSKYWLQSGDILIQRGNTIDYVGTAAIFPGPNNTYIYPDLMMRIRVAFPELGVWLATWTNFEYAKRHFRRLATGTAGNMPKINGTTLKSLPVPIPSELEIQKINDEITSLESRYHHLVDCYRDELSRSASLRQSILKDAFAGRLIPQDPNDEPASALLARIRAERNSTTQATPRGRGKRLASNLVNKKETR